MKIIDINTIYGPYTSAKSEVDVATLEDRLLKSNVYRAVTLSSYGVYHSFRDGNIRTIKQCSDVDILIPAATIDPRGYFEHDNVLEKIKENGFKMIRFFPGLQNWTLDHIVLEEILDCNKSAELPIMVNISNSGDITKLYRMAKDIVKYPVILQGVGFDNLIEAIYVMKNSTNFMIETSSIRLPSSLEYLFNEIGSDRIFFGSDACEKSIRVAIDFVISASLSDDVKEKIFFGNAKRILGDLV